MRQKVAFLDLVIANCGFELKNAKLVDKTKSLIATEKFSTPVNCSKKDY